MACPSWHFDDAICPRHPVGNCHRLFLCRASAFADGRGHFDLFCPAIDPDRAISTFSGRANPTKADYRNHHRAFRGGGDFAAKHRDFWRASPVSAGNSTGYGRLCYDHPPPCWQSASVSNAVHCWHYSDNRTWCYHADWPDV